MWKQCDGDSADDSGGIPWLQHDHSLEDQEQRMDPSGNQSGRSQDRGRCRPGIGTGEREHAACILQKIAASASVQQ